MDEIIFEILKCVVMVAALIVARYLIPWLKSVIETNNLSIIVEWVSDAVLKAQQVLSDSTGAARKEYVVDFLKSLFDAKGITITDAQLDTLIESAVKQMKMQEGEDASNADVETE